MTVAYCPLCKGVLPMCRCQIEGITAKAKATVNHERWLERGGKPRIVPADEQPRQRFVAVKRAIMLGELCVGHMRSKTLAKRTANALNKHVPNREGV